MKTVSLTSVPITLPITTIPVGPTCPEGTFCMSKDLCNQFGGTCVSESCPCYPTITTTTTTIRYPTIIPLQATEEIIVPCDYTNPSNNCCCKLPGTWTPTITFPTIHPPTTTPTTTATTSSPTSPTTQTTTTTSPMTALAVAPPSKTEAYVALGIALLIAVGGLGYWLYRKSRHQPF